ncbi:MAG: RNA 2',3'-cyclic phosphodiesterase [Clostridia bacterium]|nr:RNA 2',3'-cyclic phosphodiesterase [Clostridia bacterium]
MRLFIAIELPKSFCKELAGLQRTVREESRGGRFVPADNFHITLHFIGESNDLLGPVEAMEQAARGIRPFALHLGPFSTFPRKDGHTAFFAVRGELDECNALYESLQSALQERGFPRDQKRFTPHATLGRSVELSNEALLRLESLVPNASMQVQGITLFESVRRDGRMVYSAIHRTRF